MLKYNRGCILKMFCVLKCIEFTGIKISECNYHKDKNFTITVHHVAMRYVAFCLAQCNKYLLNKR